MLASLHIENIAVIKALDLTFEPGFTVLSGETGAGKSIILDSLNFLLGNRLSRELIRTGESRATVSAVFTDLPAAIVSAIEDKGFTAEEGTLMLSRVMTSEGRSTVRLNGQVITGAIQREIGRLLFNIHGQNDNQILLQKSSHVAVLDAYAKNEAILAQYRAGFRTLEAAMDALRACERDSASAERLKDVLEFQIGEIAAAKLKAGEEEALKKQRDKLQNIEKIDKQTKFAYHALLGSEKSAAYLLGRAAAALEQMSAVVPEAAGLSERLESCRFEIEDVAETVRDMGDAGSDDPTAALNRIESRLDVIARLERKYGADEEAVLAFLARAREQLDGLMHGEEHRAELMDRVKKALSELRTLAAALTESRRAAADELAGRIGEVLRFLDMPKVRFDVRIGTYPSDSRTDVYRADGADDVEFLISANPGEPLMPMMKIASGGELSRIMLAVKSVLSDSDGVPTVIFDEVDTGVSGKTSRKIGIKLRDIARHIQVLCVTHSAQIASLADQHDYIYKEEVDGRTQTFVRLLDPEERVEELARILGGIHVTEAQRENARELMREDWHE